MSASNRDLKILIILNDREAISPTAAQLERFGYQLSYARDVFEATNAVTSSRPALALVSWQLKSTNARSVVNLLSSRLKLRCIVFSEENDPSAAREMTKAGFAHTLPPPFYGPTAHSRIQEVLSKKTVFSKLGGSGEKNTGEFVQGRKKSNLEVPGMVIVAGDKIPSKTIWEKDSSTDDGGVTVWKGTSTSKKGRKSFYFFEGSTPPKYNSKQKNWEIAPDGLFYSKKNEKKNNNTPSTSEEEPSKARLIRKKLRVAVRKLMKEKALQKTEARAEGKNYAHLLAQCLNNSLKTFMNPSGEIIPVAKANEVIAILVNSVRFKGYLVSVGSSITDEDLMEKVFNGMNENLAAQGIHLAPFKTIKFEIDPFDFFLWAKGNSEFVVTSQEGPREIAFAFLPIKRVPEHSFTSISGYVGISVGYGLFEGEPLLFDAYLHFPENQKFIRYMKKGSHFDAKAKAKYNEFNVTNLFIKFEDLEAFYIYCAKARIRGASDQLNNQLDQKAG